MDGGNRVYSNPKSITYGPVVTVYDLDGAGNRDEVETGAGVLDYGQDDTSPDPADAQMNQYTVTPGDTNDRVYDENGNLLTTDVAAFRHDYLDRIYDRDDGTVTATYLYDALGRRIEKTVDDGATPVTTRYLYDGVRVAEEWDVPAMGAPTLNASYVYGNYIDEVLTMRRGSADYYYHADDQFNVVKLTDNTGAVVEAYDYGDYGQPEFFDAAGAVTAGTAYANPYLFTGRRWDEELGYYYFRNRYMDPVHGRFASRDPLGLWGDGANLGNGYTYAGSNPWSMVDPLGLCAGNQKEVIEGFGYEYPDPNDSRFSPEMRELLFAAYDDTLDELIIWTGNGIGYIPGPSGTLGDAIVAVKTGNYMILVEGLGGEVIGEVVGGFRRLSRAQVVAKAEQKGVKVPAGPCFTAGTLVRVDNEFVPIEKLEVGQRVISTETSLDLSSTEVDPSTWHALDLLMEDPRAPGFTIGLTILRSEEWIREYGASPGAAIRFQLPEMGIDGIARVQVIRPCPPIEDGPGNVILSTIRSMSGTVFELAVESVPEPLEPTAAHPFYSLDRQDWVPAAGLHIGEEIQTLQGPVRVLSVKPKPGLFQVFNLEVETTHQYVVTEGLVVTHNSRANPCATPVGKLVDFSGQLSVSSQEARRRLNKAVSGTGGQTHHLIPWEARNHELVRKAARAGFNMNGSNNGIRRSTSQHFGSHPAYNNSAMGQLDAILKANPRISDIDAATQVQRFADTLRMQLKKDDSVLR